MTVNHSSKDSYEMLRTTQRSQLLLLDVPAQLNFFEQMDNLIGTDGVIVDVLWSVGVLSGISEDF